MLFESEMSPWDQAAVKNLCEEVGMPVPSFGVFIPRKKRRRGSGGYNGPGRRRLVRDKRGRRRRRRGVDGRNPDYAFPAMILKKPVRRTLQEVNWKSSAGSRQRHLRDDDEVGGNQISVGVEDWRHELNLTIGKVYRTTASFAVRGVKVFIEYHPGDKLSYIPALIANAIWSDVSHKIWPVVVELIRIYFSQRVTPSKPDLLLGLDTVYNELRDVLALKMDRKRSRALGLARRHVLLVGPPGCGKTLLMRNICHFIGKRGITIYLRGFDAFEKWAPMVSMIAGIVDIPVVLVADEIDEMAQTRENQGSRTFEFLRLMDGVVDMPNVTFIATSNRPDLLDPALLRPERFCPVYTISYPDADARAVMFETFLKQYANGTRLYATGVILALAKKTEHWTGADIRAVVEDEVYAVKGDIKKFDIRNVGQRVKVRDPEIQRLFRLWNGLFNRWQKEAQTPVSLYQ